MRGTSNLAAPSLDQPSSLRVERYYVAEVNASPWNLLRTRNLYAVQGI